MLYQMNQSKSKRRSPGIGRGASACFTGTSWDTSKSNKQDLQLSSLMDKEDLQEKIFNYLSTTSSAQSAKGIASGIGKKVAKKDVNSVLYNMMNNQLICRTRDQPPLWSMVPSPFQQSVKNVGNRVGSLTGGGSTASATCTTSTTRSRSLDTGRKSSLVMDQYTTRIGRRSLPGQSLETSLASLNISPIGHVGVGVISEEPHAKGRDGAKEDLSISVMSDRVRHSSGPSSSIKKDSFSDHSAASESSTRSWSSCSNLQELDVENEKYPILHILEQAPSKARDIATQWGLSKSQVNRALYNLKEDGLIKKREGTTTTWEITVAGSSVLRQLRPVQLPTHEGAVALNLSEYSPARPTTSARYKEDFDHKCIIGGGGYGKVFKAYHTLDHNFYAVKRIKLSSRYSEKDALDEQDKVRREVEAMARLKHPNLVQYHTSWIEKHNVETQNLMDQEMGLEVSSDLESSQSHESRTTDSDTGMRQGLPTLLDGYSDDFIQFASTSGARRADEIGQGDSASKHGPSDLSSSTSSDGASVSHNRSEDSDGGFSGQYAWYLYILLELCDGSLKDRLDPDSNNHPFKDGCVKTVLTLFSGIAEAVVFLHDKDYMHRDLKPDNILLIGNNVKVGDLGLIKNIHETGDTTFLAEWRHTTDAGTEIYKSPEMKKIDGTYDEKCDMYSLGVILVELLCVFGSGSERVQVIMKLKEKPFTVRELLPNNSAEQVIIQQLLHKDPQKRPSAKEVLDWCKKRLTHLEGGKHDASVVPSGASPDV